MLLFDVFTPFYFDELDDPPGTSYVQVANGVVAFSGGGAQEWAGDYSQNIDVTLFFYGGATQSWAAPTGAQAYQQQANGFITLIGNAFQEHNPVQGGQDGQQGNGVITLLGGAFQQHQPGANPGEHLQIGACSITLVGGAVQTHVLPQFNQLVTANVETVEPYSGASVAAIPFFFGAPPPSISRITISFESDDPLFLAGTGPSGGPIFVEISLRTPGRTPLVSVSLQRPIADFFLGQNSQAFEALAVAVADGQVDLELRAYEALPSKVAPQRLGESTLTVEVLP